VKRAKPAPDIFLTAAAQLGVAPENCLVFEDAPSGVAAAKAAGMSVIAVPDPNMSHDAFADASEIIDSLELFDLEKWGLSAR
jgi:pseudouridine-5'-monophosphatase